MANSTSTNWFDVDRKGLSKIIERRGKVALIHELISNACDADGVTTVTVNFTPEESKPKVWVVVTDDSPDGFANLAHSYTLFAESNRKAHANKRGRFNLGEKLVLALCDEATIVTTTSAVMFDQRGRTSMRERRERGSEFTGLAKITRAELTEILAELPKIIPPDDVRITIDGTAIKTRTPIKTFTATLPTELADDEGILRRTARQCKVYVYEPLPGETAMLYEMGIPVVETGDRWHVSIDQKIPLNMDRDNVTPAYLREVRTLVVNQLHDQLTEADASTAFVNEALADKDASPEAVSKALDLKYGTKRAIFDPSDLEANMNLVAQGYTLIKGAQLNKGQWYNVRKHDAVNTRPAGQIAPTKKAVFAPDGKDVWVPTDKWTANMSRVVDYVLWLGRKLLDRTIRVNILSDITLGYTACFGDDALVFNLGKLGHKFFDACADGATDELNRLLIHEFGHGMPGGDNHLSAAYHDGLCFLAARLARLALIAPESFVWGAPSLEPIDNFGHHMKWADFVKAVDNGDFIDEDGYGELATATGASEIKISPSDIHGFNKPAWATHVLWYNK